MDIIKELFKLRDNEYGDFQSKLMPNVKRENIIGVRIPNLRVLAKRAVNESCTFGDMKYYEEKLLYGMIIGYRKCGIDDYLKELEVFVPLIDNWAICDCACSTYKFAVKYQKEVWKFLQKYTAGSEYEVRFVVVMMMDYFINDEYIDKVIEYLKSLKRSEYYINMAAAWAMSVIYVKYKSKALPVIEGKALPIWVHNKTIQKICESKRVDKSDKEYLKTLKIN
ncbi:MAG: DNA alkylation repair protein [Clostridiales bacterium]|nr:DNA alkylation repair protein [Clostridiales bacterium]